MLCDDGPEPTNAGQLSCCSVELQCAASDADDDDLLEDSSTDDERQRDDTWTDEMLAKLAAWRCKTIDLRLKSQVHGKDQPQRIAHYRQTVASALRDLDLKGYSVEKIVHQPKDRQHLTPLQRAVIDAAKHDARNCDVAANCLAGISLEEDFDEMPLLLAIRTGAILAIKILIACGANVESTDVEGVPALITAAKYDQPHAFRVVADELRSRSRLSEASTYKGNGYTALHFAAVNGSVRLLRTVLRYREFSRPEVLDARSERSTTGTELARDGVARTLTLYQTALHIATIYGHKRCVHLLLHCGADPNVAGHAPPPGSPKSPGRLRTRNSGRLSLSVSPKSAGRLDVRNSGQDSRPGSPKSPGRICTRDSVHDPAPESPKTPKRFCTRGSGDDSAPGSPKSPGRHRAIDSYSNVGRPASCALVSAVTNGDLAIVRLLLEYDANPVAAYAESAKIFKKHKAVASKGSDAERRRASCLAEVEAANAAFIHPAQLNAQVDLIVIRHSPRSSPCGGLPSFFF